MNKTRMWPVLFGHFKAKGSIDSTAVHVIACATRCHHTHKFLTKLTHHIMNDVVADGIATRYNRQQQPREMLQLWGDRVSCADQNLDANQNMDKANLTTCQAVCSMVRR